MATIKFEAGLNLRLLIPSEGGLGTSALLFGLYAAAPKPAPKAAMVLPPLLWCSLGPPASLEGDQVASYGCVQPCNQAVAYMGKTSNDAMNAASGIEPGGFCQVQRHDSLAVAGGWGGVGRGPALPRLTILHFQIYICT